MIAAMWHGLKVQEAIDKLGHEDILVTNLSDKKENLKVLAQLDGAIIKYFKARCAAYTKGVEPIQTIGICLFFVSDVHLHSPRWTEERFLGGCPIYMFLFSPFRQNSHNCCRSLVCSVGRVGFA